MYSSRERSTRVDVKPLHSIYLKILGSTESSFLFLLSYTVFHAAASEFISLVGITLVKLRVA